jgi:hypothetical protein
MVIITNGSIKAAKPPSSSVHANMNEIMAAPNSI